MMSIFFLFAFSALLLSWLMPNHSLPWMSWHLEALAYLSALILAWGGIVRSLRFNGPSIIELPATTMPLIGMILIAMFQRSIGLIHWWGEVWVLWCYVALCIACLMCGAASVSSANGLTRSAGNVSRFYLLPFVILSGALVSTFIAGIQAFSFWNLPEWIVRMPDLRRPGGNLAQPNHLATLLVMGVASLLFFRQSKKFGALTFGLLLIVLCLGIAMTESRTGALSLLLLLGWWLLKRRRIGDVTPAWVGIGCGIGFAGLFWVWPKLLNLMLLTDNAAVNASSSLRTEVWPQLLHAVFLKPWWGWGFHQTAQAHNAVANAYAVSSPFSYSHNLVLDLMLWFGIPLTALLVLVTGVWLWRRMRAANQLLPWYGLAVALPLAVHSMLEYPFAYAYFLAPTMLALGAVDGSLGIKPLLRVSAKPVVALLLVTTLGLAWSVVEYLQIEEDFRVARFEALHIGSPPAEHQPPTIILFDQLGVLLDDARITPTPNMTPQAMQTVKRAALYYPWSATQYRYAMALALNGDPVEAARQFKVMRLFWGEPFYQSIKAQSNELANTKYPELHKLKLP